MTFKICGACRKSDIVIITIILLLALKHLNLWICMMKKYCVTGFISVKTREEDQIVTHTVLNNICCRTFAIMIFIFSSMFFHVTIELQIWPGSGGVHMLNAIRAEFNHFGWLKSRIYLLKLIIVRHNFGMHSFVFVSMK